MQERRRWLTRIGSLMIVLGFVFPSMLVSCTGMSAVQESLSLMNVAKLTNTPSLYLALLAIITIPILSILNENRLIRRRTYLWSVLGLVVTSLVIIAAVISYLESQVRMTGAFTFSPDYGMFFLIAGYILLAIGMIGEWQIRETRAPGVLVLPPVQQIPPQINPNTGSAVDDHQPMAGIANLRLVEGRSTQKTVMVRDSFTIGRGNDNSLVLPDTSVSRRHVCFRTWNGAWFLQDQNSTGGTFVNGHQIQALRLNPGDRITIGKTSFIFELTKED